MKLRALRRFLKHYTPSWTHVRAVAGLALSYLLFPRMWSRRLGFSCVDYFSFFFIYCWQLSRRGRSAMLHFDRYLISDLMAIRFSESAEPLLRTFFRQDHVNFSTWQARYLAVCLSSLRWLGYLQEATALSLAMCRKRAFRSEGCLSLADTHHLLALWSKELRSYRDIKSWINPKEIDSSGSGIFMIPEDWESAFEVAFKWYRLSLHYKVQSKALAGYAEALVAASRFSEAAEIYQNLIDLYPENHISKIRLATLKCLIEPHRVSAAEIDQTVHDADAEVSLQPSPNSGLRGHKIKKKMVMERQRVVKRRHIVAEVKTIHDICKLTGAECIEVVAPTDFSYSYRLIFNGNCQCRVINLTFEAAYLTKLENVTNLGYGFLLVDDKYLASDTKHVNAAQAKIFCTALQALNDSHAVIALPLERQTVNAHHSVILSNPDNYYHWIIEAVGRAAVFNNAIDMDSVSILTEEKLKPYQLDSLTAIAGNLAVSTSLPRYPEIYRIDKVTYLTHLSKDQIAHPKVVEVLRQHHCSGRMMPTRGKWIYLDRVDTKRASITNASEVRSFLKRHGFQVVDSGRMSFAEQITFFSDAEIIIGAGGAALTNLLFCPAGAKVVILAPLMGAFETFNALAANAGMETWICLGQITHCIPNPYFVWTEWGFSIDLSDLKMAIEQCFARLSENREPDNRA